MATARRVKLILCSMAKIRTAVNIAPIRSVIGIMGKKKCLFIPLAAGKWTKVI